MRGDRRRSRIRWYVPESRRESVRHIWDQHYADLAAGCAKTVPDMPTVEDILVHAFVKLLIRRAPPTDPLTYVTRQVDRLTKEYVAQHRCPATSAQDVVCAADPSAVAGASEQVVVKGGSVSRGLVIGSDAIPYDVAGPLSAPLAPDSPTPTEKFPRARAH